MKVIISIILLLNLAACTTQKRSIDVQAADIDSQSLVGERVEVQLLDCSLPEWAGQCSDEETLTFTVQAMMSDGLEGKYGLVPFDQVASMKLLDYEMHDATRAGLGFAGELGLQVLATILGIALAAALAGG